VGDRLSDNEFCADEERFGEFTKMAREKGLKFPFSMDRRIDGLTLIFLRDAKMAGCRMILYGLESGSKTILNRIRKNFSPDL